jgi:hypothetical protein
MLAIPGSRVRGVGIVRMLTISVLSMALACGSTPPAPAANPGTADDASSVTPSGDPDAGPNPTTADAAFTADPASPDSSTSPTTTPDAGLALFDDFESAAAGGPPSTSLWTLSQPDCTGTGTLVVDGSQAHAGTHSVRVDGGGGYCDHVFFANTSAIAAVGKEIYVRFFVRLGAALGDGHVTFMSMMDQADGGNYLRMGGQDAILMYNRQSDDATLPTLSPTGIGDSTMPAAQAWVCIESHVDETAGTIDTWVDGKEILGLVENGTPVADISTQWLSKGAWKPSLANVRFGWESYAGQTMTLWFDDVAVADHRIGCGG